MHRYKKNVGIGEATKSPICASWCNYCNYCTRPLFSTMRTYSFRVASMGNSLRLLLTGFVLSNRTSSVL